MVKIKRQVVTVEGSMINRLRKLAKANFSSVAQIVRSLLNKALDEAEQASKHQ